MSSPPEIYGHLLSQPSRTVYAFCSLSSIPYTFKEVEFLSGGTLTADFTRINPHQEIPTLVDQSFVLWESGAIIAYLADTYAVDNQWFPRDPKSRAKITAYIYWHQVYLRQPLVTYLRSKIIYPRFLGKPELTPAQEEPFVKRTKGLLRTLSWILKDTGYIARTKQATVADIFAFSELASAIILPLNLKEYPVVQVWYNKIAEIPEVQKTHAMQFELNKALSPSPKL
jgi:glutathione S-transferase